MNNKNKDNPTLSIGMPVYNGEQWLSDAIESILAQSYADFELIISDNASTDKTEDICRHWAKNDKRIRYIRNEKNLGANPNFNKVFTESRGTYFKWASCNDLLHPDMLKECVTILDQHTDVVLAFPNTKLFYQADGEYKKYDDIPSLTSDQPEKRFQNLIENLGLNNIMNGVFRAEALAKTKLIKSYFSSDNVLMAEVSLHGKFINVPDYLFYRRMDEASATALMDEKELTRHYHPDSTSKMIFQQWILHLNYLKAVLRTRLTPGSKIKSLYYVLKNAMWHRADLFRDLKRSLHALPAQLKTKRAFSTFFSLR